MADEAFIRRIARERRKAETHIRSFLGLLDAGHEVRLIFARWLFDLNRKQVPFIVRYRATLVGSMGGTDAYEIADAWKRHQGRMLYKFSASLSRRPPKRLLFDRPRRFEGQGSRGGGGCQGTDGWFPSSRQIAALWHAFMFLYRHALSLSLC
jgi:hypothetical protein